MGAAETVEAERGRDRGAEPVAHLALAGPPTSFYARIGKPVFDRVVAALLFVLTLPIVLARRAGGGDRRSGRRCCSGNVASGATASRSRC